MGESSTKAGQKLTWVIIAMAMLAGSATARAGSPGIPCPPAEDPRPNRIYSSPLLGRIWVRAEYLIWSTESETLPPLVTTSSLATLPGDAGVIGQGDTSVLFGDGLVNTGMVSGGRFTLGCWQDLGQTRGVQATYFGLTDQKDRYFVTSDDQPIIARPFVDATDGLPDRELVAYPGLLVGDVYVEAVTRFQGAEVLWRRCLAANGAMRLHLLAGYRFGQLVDRLAVDQASESLDAASGYDVGTLVFRSDSFASHNNFHGAELGLNAGWRRGCWSTDVVAKVALGGTATSIDIDGHSTIIDDGGTTEYDGGLLALPSNIGRHTGGHFAACPEFRIALQYHHDYYTRISVGYDLLGWSAVSRAVRQIDTQVNPTQIPPDSLNGEARPRFAMKTDSFWAQGLSIRLESQF